MCTGISTPYYFKGHQSWGNATPTLWLLYRKSTVVMQHYTVPKHLNVRPSAPAASEAEVAVSQPWNKFTENCTRVQIITGFMHKAPPEQKGLFSVPANVHMQVFRKSINFRSSFSNLMQIDHKIALPTLLPKHFLPDIWGFSPELINGHKLSNIAELFVREGYQR